jgi:hypothetical protein
MSQTIYARVPDHVKQATDAYATSSGSTLAGAVADLLDRGLQAASDSDSISQLQRTISDLQIEVEKLREREQMIGSANQALAQRITRPVGNCPACGHAVTGQDLLITGSCPQSDCGASLTPLLDPPLPDERNKGTLNDGDFKLLLGALGLALGIVLISQGGGG